MMKFSKSALLVAATMAVCAFAPSMASAASWSPVGSAHTLDSPNTGFVSAGITSSCAESSFTTTGTSAADLRITAATFRRCTSSGAAIGSCTTTSNATNLPWRATPITTTNVQIHDIVIDVRFENHPGSTACGANGVNLLLTGTITNADYNNTTRELFLVNASGLVGHSVLGNNVAAAANGTFRDTAQTLVILP